MKFLLFLCSLSVIYYWNLSSNISASNIRDSLNAFNVNKEKEKENAQVQKNDILSRFVNRESILNEKRKKEQEKIEKLQESLSGGEASSSNASQDYKNTIPPSQQSLKGSVTRPFSPGSNQNFDQFQYNSYLNLNSNIDPFEHVSIVYKPKNLTLNLPVIVPSYRQINSYTESANTILLFESIRNGNNKILQNLIEDTRNLNSIRDRYGENLLCYALRSNNLNGFLILFEFGLDMPEKCGNIAIETLLNQLQNGNNRNWK